LNHCSNVVDLFSVFITKGNAKQTIKPNYPRKHAKIAYNKTTLIK